MGVVINRPATHKLYKGKEVLYMLKSDTINLDDYWGLYVGVQGTVVPAPQGWNHDIIEVTEITILDHEKRTPPRE